MRQSRIQKRRAGRTKATPHEAARLVAFRHPSPSAAARGFAVVVGHEPTALDYVVSRRDLSAKRPVLEDLSLGRDYQRVSLTIREGEIVGLTGRLGSGRTELALSLAMSTAGAHRDDRRIAAAANAAVGSSRRETRSGRGNSHPAPGRQCPGF